MAEQQVDPSRQVPGADGLLFGLALRPIGGAQNDLVTPALDATPGSSEIRLGPQNFDPGTTDGVTPGPNARTVSNVMSSGPQAETTDPTRSAWIYVFGQFIDHDLDLETLDPSKPLSIAVPAGDPDLPDGTVIPTGGRASLDAMATSLTQSPVSRSVTSLRLGRGDGSIAPERRRDAEDVRRQLAAGRQWPLRRG